MFGVGGSGEGNDRMSELEATLEVLLSKPSVKEEENGAQREVAFEPGQPRISRSGALPPPGCPGRQTRVG